MNAEGKAYAWENAKHGFILHPPPPGLLDPPPKQATNGPDAHTAHSPHLAADSRGDAYGQAALTGEADAVASAPQGQRNDQLFKSAARLFRLVNGGACGISEHDVRGALYNAARACGLDHAEIIATLDSAWNSTRGEIATRPSGANRAHGSAPQPAQGPPPCQKPRLITPRSWHDLAPPPRRWAVHDLVPDLNVTLLYGDGGVGKSVLAIQLMVGCTALGGEWLGYETSPRKALGLFCEDDEDELHRRTAAVADHNGVSLHDLGDHLRFITGVDSNNLLAEFDDDGREHATPLYQELLKAALDFGARLFVVDALHDVFDGDEVRRAQARRFVGLLRQFARRIDGAVLLSAHPSLTGINTGTGTSGSTGWHNTCRSRLYVKRADEGKPEEGLILQQKKNQYGRLASDIELHGAMGSSCPRDSATRPRRPRQRSSTAWTRWSARAGTSRIRRTAPASPREFSRR